MNEYTIIHFLFCKKGIVSRRSLPIAPNDPLGGGRGKGTLGNAFFENYSEIRRFGFSNAEHPVPHELSHHDVGL